MSFIIYKMGTTAPISERTSGDNQKVNKIVPGIYYVLHKVYRTFSVTFCLRSLSSWEGYRCGKRKCNSGHVSISLFF